VARTIDLGDGVAVKLRRPWGAFTLAIVTFGLYYLFWYYLANRELALAARIKVIPRLSLLAITAGALLIVPPFVSEWRFYGRIRRAQREAGFEHPINHVLGFGLWLIALFFLPFEIVYAQRELNRLWSHYESEQRKRLDGLRGEPAAA
jgi:hypothetical protein